MVTGLGKWPGKERGFMSLLISSTHLLFLPPTPVKVCIIDRTIFLHYSLDNSKSRSDWRFHDVQRILVDDSRLKLTPGVLNASK